MAQAVHTVGELRRVLTNLPDNMKIEDQYGNNVLDVVPAGDGVLFVFYFTTTWGRS